MAPKVSINRRFSKFQSNSISFKNKRRRKVQSKSHSPSLYAPFIVSPIGQVWSVSQANKPNKSPKHRWKLNGSGSDGKSTFDYRCMTNTRRLSAQKLQRSIQQQQQQQQFPHNETPQDVQKVDEQCHRLYHGEVDESASEKLHHFIRAKCSQHENVSRKQTHFHDVSTGKKSKPQRRDFVNCRKLFEWTTASSVRKLLPIFILVNMLPFLYAGESHNQTLYYGLCMR
jgi:hypothetical protein